MIKCQCRQVLYRKPLCIFSISIRFQYQSGGVDQGKIGHRDDPETGITVYLVAKGIQLLQEADCDTRLVLQLTHHGCIQSFIIFYKATGQGPLSFQLTMLAPDQQHQQLTVAIPKHYGVYCNFNILSHIQGLCVLHTQI
ncbi:hypothetical protein D9M68_797600 [compost metagenome]